MIVDPEDYVLLSREIWVNTFERTPFDSRDYIQVLDGVKNNVLTGTTPKLGRISGRQLYVGSIDQDGQACTRAGNEIIHRIASKCERDFQQLQSSRQTPYVKGIIKKVISRAGWLYKATPPNIISHIRKVLTSDAPAGLWRSVVEAGGRAFGNVDDFRTLFARLLIEAKIMSWVPVNSRNTQEGPSAASSCSEVMATKDLMIAVWRSCWLIVLWEGFCRSSRRRILAEFIFK